MTKVPTDVADRADGPTDWRSVEGLELAPILSASLDAFFEFGFHGASVREIARRVGVTVPSLYYHYQSKEGLLIALLERSISDLRSRARAANAAGDGDPVQRLANVIFTIVLQMTNQARLAALEGEARYLCPENWERYRAMRKSIETLVLETVRDGNSAGDFAVDDPAETTRAILGMCQAIPRWYQTEGKLSPAAVAGKYVVITLKMVGAVRRPVMPRSTNRTRLTRA
ncbi:TetR/AcrR family transcriptional regulator [Nocardia cyriacigeorgica]|uniref:TetR/AcrR family transcriptional regulator n=1 Tax=Nocardia cyriacigeorgica TaxID=135487 RepID=UPI0013D4E33A|nr:TetR/AcrR family transcriptional regulator [Nocardia cyriacigeorgica]NEW27090.1 TetR/AcrR family transcriptional regulator [Nocardia cyriacigeorgica]